MNRTEAIAALHRGDRIKRQGGVGYWEYHPTDGSFRFYHQNGTVCIASMGDYTDYEVVKEPHTIQPLTDEEEKDILFPASNRNVQKIKEPENPDSRLIIPERRKIDGQH